jgi:hypothetical protein
VTPSIIAARFSRVAAGALFLGLIALELCSLPVLVLGMALLGGGPNPPKLAAPFGPFVILSPLIAIAILVACWMWLERHRKFYPPTAVLLVAGWVAFFVLVGKSSLWAVIATYALWHVLAFDRGLSLFGLA